MQYVTQVWGTVHRARNIKTIESKMDKKRKSIRLRDYDYTSPGAYLVTVCTRGHDCLFGSVIDGRMKLNVAGRVVQSVWDELPDHYSNVETDAFVIMPNHIHGIIVLVDGIDRPDCPVGAGFKPAPASVRLPVHTKRHGLPEIMRGLKTFSARNINTVRGTPGIPVWQRGYHEHVIRKTEDINRVRDYIMNNPLRWSLRKG